jgi:hypothetical protein
VKLCLSYGAKNDPHPEFGQTALHAAVSESQYSCAAAILKAAAISEADIIICNLTDPKGRTPLHCAALIGSTNLVELLLQHGADYSSTDNCGHTPLHLCAGSGFKSCLAVLLDYGADCYIEVSDHNGNNALHHAVFNGHLECVRLLLETAADVTARNKRGNTPYNIASSSGHHQIGLLLLEYRDNQQQREHTPQKNRKNNAQLDGKIKTKTRASSYTDEKSKNNEYYSTPAHHSLTVNDTVLSNSSYFDKFNNKSAGNNNYSINKPIFLRNDSYFSDSSNDINSSLPRPHTLNSPSLQPSNLTRSNKNTPNSTLSNRSVTTSFSISNSPVVNDSNQFDDFNYKTNLINTVFESPYKFHNYVEEQRFQNGSIKIASKNKSHFNAQQQETEKSSKSEGTVLFKVFIELYTIYV